MIQLNNPTLDACLKVECEVDRARGRFPSNRHMLAALIEEVGELAQALLQEKEDWREEALHCACVAVRIMTEGDADFAFTQESTP